MSVRLQLDGREVEALEGESILELARRSGVELPTLCDFPSHPNGVCRMCMVETDASGRAVPACSTPARAGMQVRTDTAHLDVLRRGLLTLLLAQHRPHAAAGRCRLEELATRYAVPLVGTLTEGVPADDSHPAIRFDPSICILCRKCLIACDDEQVNDVIGLSGRGGATRVSFDLDVALSDSRCVSCGACVDACPTGALLEKGWAPAERTVVTTCPYCGVGCTVEYGLLGRRILWARGVRNGSVNDGKLCVKGKFAFQHETSADRLLTPLRRREGIPRAPLGSRAVEEVFRPISWEEALSLLADRIRATRAEHGPTAIAGIACDRATNEDIFAFQKFMRAVAGTDNVDQSATLCHAPSAAMLAWATGAGAATNPVGDILRARTILLVGSNTERAHPVVAANVKRAARRGAHLIIVDPRRLEIGRLAEMTLTLKPGTDVVLFSAMAKYILDSGWEDREFIETRTEGFAEWAASLGPFTLEYASSVTGVPVDLIRRASETYARERPSSILWTLGITEHENGSDNVSSLVNLGLLTGNVGRPGSGLNPLRGQNNVQGGADMGSTPGSLPGYQALADPATRRKFEARWERPLPEVKGWKSTEMIPQARNGLIRLLYISGENSVRSHPDSASVADAFAKVDFLAVQDLYLTETAEYADLVLPAASSYEKTGTFTNMERRVQMVRALFDPPGEARADWEIYSELATRLGYPMHYANSGEIMDEISDLLPSYAGIRHERLASVGLQWPIGKDEARGESVLHVHEFARGRGRFRPLQWTAHGTELAHEYPYILVTGRQREQYHTGTMTRRTPVVEALADGPVVEMSPEDLLREGLTPGMKIRVTSPQGSLVANVGASPALPRGMLFTTFHYAELPVNQLTPPTLDPTTKTPAYKDARVKVERVR
jgi:formate dehydrogenase alpha subunit